MTDRLEPGALARKIVDLLSEKQAEDILLLDIRRVATFADYFVIAHGRSERQIEAMLDALQEELRKVNINPLGREGSVASGWVLLDLGDVVVHLFGAAERAYYNLESLWHAGTPVVRIQ
ncbi:MAG TPA: ribosome silencing factor [Dehalococcoidia bacterium]|nr:ribosome silencing factor [Dehalococcoidia bacterium]